MLGVQMRENLVCTDSFLVEGTEEWIGFCPLERRRPFSMHVRVKTYGQGTSDRSVPRKQNVVVRDQDEKGLVTQRL